MSGLKNSPFGKRLRASHHEESTSTPDPIDPPTGRRTRQRVNPIFGVSSSTTTSASSTPTLDGSSAESGVGAGAGRSESPVSAKDYGDRFVPSRDSG
ncbi:hypothetical protein JAAARDRAFT_90769, partial [Jaapia argillacea MUCL 33604]